jgi:hypothetical protein
MPIVTEREYRAMSLPLSIVQAGIEKRFNTKYYAEGYATTFDTPYVLYEYDGIKYYEVVDRNALDEADVSDVIFQFNHSGKPLARLSNKSLGLEVDSKGLFVFTDLSHSRAAKDLHEEIAARLIDKMSWGFRVSEDSYNEETRTRTILKIKKIYDVSAVSYPANGDTEISVRSFVDGVIDKEKREALARQKQRLLLNTKL